MGLVEKINWIKEKNENTTINRRHMKRSNAHQYTQPAKHQHRHRHQRISTRAQTHTHTHKRTEAFICIVNSKIDSSSLSRSPLDRTRSLHCRIHRTNPYTFARRQRKAIHTNYVRRLHNEHVVWLVGNESARIGHTHTHMDGWTRV